MLCEKPYFIGTVPCACTRCFPCRINKRRLWAHRILLESLVSSDSCFVTLTYNDDYLPKSAELVPGHVQKWLKRIRKLVYPQKLRYFLVGEYGKDHLRPHYHVALFGIHPFIAGGLSGQSGFVAKTWSYGFTYVGELNRDSAMYIAGYCTKKMTSKKDPRLNGKYPEFSRMSLRPGVGATAMRDVAESLRCETGDGLLKALGDVPHALSHNRRALPLGRYLRRVLRKELGRAQDAPLEAQKKYAQEMRQMFEDGVKTAKDKKAWNVRSPRRVWKDLTDQKIRNLKSRTAIYEKEKSL